MTKKQVKKQISAYKKKAGKRAVQKGREIVVPGTDVKADRQFQGTRRKKTRKPTGSIGRAKTKSTRARGKFASKPDKAKRQTI